MAGYPGYDNTKYVQGSDQVSGTAAGGTDPTNEPGQYPPGMAYERELFGGTLPTGTGAPGTAGGDGQGGDPTTEPGQLVDGLTGITPREITQTGAPGTQGSTENLGNGSDSITFTKPTSGVVTYETLTVRDNVSGPGDWTQANDDGYASGGPQLPGIKGNEPQAGQGRFQPGRGTVMRGGRSVRP
jgi:hypothetical protein